MRDIKVFYFQDNVKKVIEPPRPLFSLPPSLYLSMLLSQSLIYPVESEWNKILNSAQNADIQANQMLFLLTLGLLKIL